MDKAQYRHTSTDIFVEIVEETGDYFVLMAIKNSEDLDVQKGTRWLAYKNIFKRHYKRIGNCLNK